MKVDYLLETSSIKNKTLDVRLDAVNMMTPEKAAVYQSRTRSNQVMSIVLRFVVIFMLGVTCVSVLKCFGSDWAIIDTLYNAGKSSAAAGIFFLIPILLIGAALYAVSGEILYASGRLQGASYQVSSGLFISCKVRKKARKKHSRGRTYYLLVTFVDENGVQRAATSPYENKDYMKSLIKGSPLAIVSVNGFLGKKARVVFPKQYFSEVKY